MPNNDSKEENMLGKDLKAGTIIGLAFCASRSVFGLIFSGIVTAGVINYLHYAGQKKQAESNENQNATSTSYFSWPFGGANNQSQTPSQEHWAQGIRKNISHGSEDLFDKGLELSKNAGTAVYTAACDTLSKRLNP